MNVEENRLNTFNDWPSNVAVSPARIAKAGFYAINQDLIVECFSCHIRISDWNYGDQVMARHRTLSPVCPFVVDPSNSGNVPISQAQNRPETASATVTPDNISELDSPDYEQSYVSENMRLQSFRNWPISHIVTAERLARAGFYYLNQRDKTKCAYCNGIVVAWEAGDDPDREHKRHFPNCHFVRNVINQRLEETERNPGPVENVATIDGLPNVNVNVVSQVNLDELGINTHRGPKNSAYATLESRLQTFTTWPDDVVQTPDTLAQAGFYYEGSRDQVRCFHCDGGLRHWDPQDDPWTEHARWFPKCAYILLIKGPDFVRVCSVDHDNASNVAQQNWKCARPTQRRQITDQEIQDQMLTPQVMTALSIGLHVGRIKQAIKEKLERTGMGFSTADAVIEAALNIQHEEEEIDSTSIPDHPIATSVQEAIRTIQESCIPNHIPTPPPAVPQNVSESSNAADVPEPPQEGRSMSLEEENRLLKEARMCKICMDKEVGIVFLPCGHLATCINCAPNLKDCPVCRCSIKATVRTFLS